MNLTNDEAQFFINLQKKLNDIILNIPSAGKIKKYSLSDMEETRSFIARMRLANGNRPGRSKATYNLFYDNSIQLLRIDTFGTGIHVNSDGSIIEAHTPHIHIYDEVEQDHNAYPLPSSFTNPTDLIKTLLDFLTYANVIDIDRIQIVEQGGINYEGIDTN